MNPTAHPVGAVLVANGADDGGRPLTATDPASRRSVWARSAVLAAAVLVAYGRPLRSLMAGLATSNPLAFAAFAPAAALVTAMAAVRRAPLGSPRLANRSSERIIGGALLAVAVTLSCLLPRTFGFDTGAWHASLASLPLFLSGGVIWLFGARVAFWARHGLLVVAGAAPLYYAWAVNGLQRTTTAVTATAVVGVARVVGTTTVEVGGDRLLGVGGQLVTVGSVCSGANSMLGWAVVAGALATVLSGPLHRKMVWAAAGAGLVFAGNVARLAGLALVGRVWGAGAAISVLHPYAGTVTLALSTAAGLAIAAPLGLRPRPPVVASVRARLAAVAPRRWWPEAVVLLAVCGLLGAVSARGWRVDRLGGRNGVVNLSALAVLGSPAPDAGAAAAGRSDALAADSGAAAAGGSDALAANPGATGADGSDAGTADSRAAGADGSDAGTADLSAAVAGGSDALAAGSGALAAGSGALRTAPRGEGARDAAASDTDAPGVAGGPADGAGAGLPGSSFALAGAGTVVDLGVVDWAAQYFGAGAVWHRYTVLQPASASAPGAPAISAGAAAPLGVPTVDAMTVAAVDVTAVRQRSDLDTYPLEACYGFHGYQLDAVAVTSLEGRPAEQIVYVDGPVGTVVLSWRQRTAAGYERIVVSSQFRSDAAPPSRSAATGSTGGADGADGAGTIDGTSRPGGSGASGWSGPAGASGASGGSGASGAAPADRAAATRVVERTAAAIADASWAGRSR